MKNRLLLINPVSEKEIGSHSSIFPLQLGIIVELIPENFNIEIIDENFEKFCFRDCDIVLITSRSKNIYRAYEIALVYKQKNIPVVLGGIHGSFFPEEALQYVHTVVIGEAENNLKNVLDDFTSNKLKKKYQTAEYFDLQRNIIPRRDFFSKKYSIATIQTARGCPMNCHYCSVPLFNGKKIRRRPIENVLDELEQIPQKMIFFC